MSILRGLIGSRRLDVEEDANGRVRFLTKCDKCGADMWVREPNTNVPVLKNVWKGECGNCRKTNLRYVTKTRVPVPQELCRDVDKIVAYLKFRAIAVVDPMLLAAAVMLEELNEKHWSECLQIAQYDEQLNGRKHTDE